MRTPQKCKSKSRTKSASTTSSICKSLTLALLESNPLTQDRPEPLKVFHPRVSLEKSLRRSPRITLSDKEFKSGNVAKKLRLIAPSHCLRRSPRLSRNEPKLNASLDVSPEKKVTRKIVMETQRILDDNCFRRSTRFDDNSAENGEANYALAKSQRTKSPLPSNGYDEKTKANHKSFRFFSTSANAESIRSKTFNKLFDSSDDKMLNNGLTSSVKSDLNTLDEEGLMIEPDNDREKCISLPGPCKAHFLQKEKTSGSSENKKGYCRISFFIGDSVPSDEAQEKWRWRYELKNLRSKGKTLKLNEDEEDEVVLDVECHFSQARIGNCVFNLGNCVFNLGDCAYIQGSEPQNHVGRIIEFFRTTKGENYFRVQWFYRLEDTVIKEGGGFHNKRRLFYSSIMNYNLIDCIISKVNVTQLNPGLRTTINSISPSDFFCDMEYCVEYSTFRSMVMDNSIKSHYISSPRGVEAVPTIAPGTFLENMPSCETQKSELSLLDLYCGCGGMSSGLCLGAKLSSVNLVTRWALDIDKSACESFKLNHPKAYVRNEAGEDFLELLKEWEKLCKRYKFSDAARAYTSLSEKSREAKDNDEIETDEFEVSRLVDICYGDPNKTGKRGLNFKVQWKGYSASEDTWEPAEGLSDCQESIQEFVENGMRLKILPLRDDVDVICGGPPCQGISGYNRFRNEDSPLDDERNHQIVTFMDIVMFLKPKFVLMENVVDILRFGKASLARYALSRLVHMNYQARLGTIAAGCYGLPQFRLRVFIWGAHPNENLPPFPLPTHDVIVRYWPPPEFERNTVAYDEGQPRDLKNAIVLQDAISDLPAVTHCETREEMSYQNPPETGFQKYIRSTNFEMTGSALNGTEETKAMLYDHRPYPLHEDDYLRVCRIPKRKGANFRDLPGVVVGSDNVARRDPSDNMLLPSGKPLVPDYAFTFEQGKSKRSFARLWWDETVPTVLTFPSCHNQVALHPEQDRILTVREYARLQGFPDYYRFCGTVKKRYCQVGNAVAVPVGRAIGYCLGLAIRKLSDNEPLMALSPKFSHSNHVQFTNVLPDDID